MIDIFTIEVDSGDNLRNCKYIAGDDRVQPGIMIDNRKIFTRARCYAILRKLAELSDENVSKQIIRGSDPYPYYKVLGGLFKEEELLEMLWEVLKDKYRKKTLTPEQKIDKAHEELSEIYNSGMPHDLNEAWKKIGNVLDILNQP